MPTRPSDDLAHRSRRTLVIGWKTGLTPALEALGQEVAAVVATTDLPAARASGFAGPLIAVRDPASVEDVISGLERHHIDAGSFGSIGSNLEPTVVTASVLGSLVRARCVDPRAAILLRDKIAQKNAVRGKGIPTAACFPVDTITDLMDSPARYPVVFKPVAGAGTADTHLLSNAGDTRRLSESLGPRGHGPWSVEEFIEGAELAANGVVRDGEVVMLAVSRYLENLLAIKHGGPVGTVLLRESEYGELYARVRALTGGVLDALGHRDGVFHLEAFDQGDRLVFSECAGRAGGGMLQEMLELKYGVDLVGEWARAVVGLPPRIPAAPRDERCFGMANLLCPPGRISAIPTAVELAEFDGVVAAQVSAKVDDTAPDTRKASNLRVGRFVVAAATEDEVTERLLSVIADFRDRTAVEP